MENEQSTANPAAEPIDVSADIVSLDAAPEAPTPVEGDLDDLVKEALGSEDANPDDELVEVEYEGKTIKVSAAAKDALLRQADYTKKTMDLAEQRKALENDKQFIEQVRNVSTAKVNAMAQAQSLDIQIQQLENLSIQGLTQEQINGYRMDLRDLMDQKNMVLNDIAQLANTEREAQTLELGKLRETALQQASALVPNWSDTRRTELESLAKELGADLDPNDITEPWAYKVLHFADIGKKFIERQTKAGQMKAAQAGKPATTLNGSNAGGKDASEMTMAEYAAARKAGAI